MTFKPKQLDPKTVKIFSENEVGTLLEDIDNKLELILGEQNSNSHLLEKLINEMISL